MTNIPAAFPQITAPFIDLKTGEISIPWLQFLRQLWYRTGQGGGSIPVGGVLTGMLPDPGLANNAVATVNISDNNVTLAKLQQITTQRLLGRDTAALGNVEQVTISQVLDWLSSTRGTILTRNATAWVGLGPGAIGLPVVGAGAAADVQFGATLGASGAGLTGVYFDVSASPLDAYEIGTFTPTLIGSSTPGTQTYATQAGWYVKIGDLVACWGNLTITAKDGAMAGNLLVGGLPFTSITTALQAGSISEADEITLTAGNSFYGLQVQAGAATAAVRQSGTGIAPSAIGVAALAASGGLNFNCVYRAA